MSNLNQFRNAVPRTWGSLGKVERDIKENLVFLLRKIKL